ncbi:DUF523 domain-containing protein [Konateibacter massiliensis]|uniref:DUF523 domain-containing protein n=1 Tax=Konateibacter massiliensis TaxID=2002841 RepID=UPI000C15EF65|nr:DUF523 domain-containing protein [Konateibacter massiliensis]
MNILVSACLLGVECRYDGTGKLVKEIECLKEKHNLIPVCPEIYGGLSTPREPAEKCGNAVLTRTGKDVTYHYEKGAEEVLKLAKMFDCSVAILKKRSPSCGSGEVYDGTFAGRLVKGDGILTKRLKENKIQVFGEGDIEIQNL